MPLKHTVEEIVLKNGARGLIVYVPDATVVSYAINFRAGNQYASSEAKQQTAHIMEHMVFGATKSIKSAEEFSRQFTKNGAYYNATTYQRNMTYVAEAPLMDWDRILELQKLAICEPLFSEELLKVEKENVREELTGDESKHRRLLWQRLYRDMGGPLLTDTEKKTTIDAVTLEDIQNHHKQTHTTANMRFCIVGDFAQHREKIVKIFEEWPLPRGKELPIIPEKLCTANARRVFRKDTPGIEVALHIVLNRTFSLAELSAMRRLNYLLTGTFHSRIFGKARTRGLSYGVRSSIDTSIEGVTRLEISGQVSAKNMKALYALVAQELQQVAEGAVSDEELNDAKSYALGDYQFKGQRVYDLGQWYSSDYFEDLTIDPVEDTPKYITEVTVQSIRKLMNEFLDEGSWAVGAVGTIENSELKAVHDELAPIFKAQV